MEVLRVLVGADLDAHHMILARCDGRFNEGEAGLSRAAYGPQDLVPGSPTRTLSEVRGDQRHLVDLPPGPSYASRSRTHEVTLAGRPRRARVTCGRKRWPSTRRAGPRQRRTARTSQPVQWRVVVRIEGGVEHARAVGVRERAATGDPHPEPLVPRDRLRQQVVEEVERSLGQLRGEGERHVPLPGVGPPELRRFPTHGRNSSRCSATSAAGRPRRSRASRARGRARSASS